MVSLMTILELGQIEDKKLALAFSHCNECALCDNSIGICNFEDI